MSAPAEILLPCCRQLARKPGSLLTCWWKGLGHPWHTIHAATVMTEHMPFTQRTLNAFEMLERPAACEIPCWIPGHRAFVGVYPPGKRLKKWLVRRFSIPEGLVHEYFGEKDIVDDQKIDLESLEAVEELLRGWSIDASLFDAPWKSDYPL
jgi:hypothetical protein